MKLLDGKKLVEVMTWTLLYPFLFIDVLKFMQEKAGSSSASKWISYLRNMQYQGRGCYYRPFEK